MMKEVSHFVMCKVMEDPGYLANWTPIDESLINWPKTLECAQNISQGMRVNQLNYLFH